MKDYTIEVWSIFEQHYAKCSCEWLATSDYQPILERMVRKHRKAHADKGEATEVV